MSAKLQAIIDKVTPEMENALRLEAEQIMTRSKRSFVPHDLGTLSGTGQVNDPVVSGKSVEITLGFGGAAAPYALAIHEHPSASTPPSWEGKAIVFSPAGTGPKYLERPLKAATKDMHKRLAASLKSGGLG